MRVPNLWFNTLFPEETGFCKVYGVTWFKISKFVISELP